MPPALLPYQQEGCQFLQDNRHAYLADEPGLGKTAQAITAADCLGLRKILVLCPSSLKSNWRREFLKFGTQPHMFRTPKASTRLLDPGPGVTLVNWDLLSKPALVRQLQRPLWDAIIGDEAHTLKNEEAQRTQAVLAPSSGLYMRAQRVWLLSGTPTPNHLGELYAVLRVLHPSAVGDLRYSAWVKKYCHVKDTIYGLRVMGYKPSFEAELKPLLQRFILRRRVADVLPDLPDLRTAPWYLDGAAAKAQVEHMHADHAELDLLMALADQDHLDEDALEELDASDLSTLRRLCGEAKAPLVAEQVASELDQGRECIVLMCWHHSTMDLLQEKLAKYGVARVDGSTKDPDAEVQKFQLPSSSTSCRVFIGQIISAGTGHTLTRARDMVMVEPSWVPGDNEQAMRRIRRIGQQHPCNVRFAALAGTLDEGLMSSAERKARLIAQTY